MHELLTKQRDLYRFINDETLRKLNHGETMREVAEDFTLPDSLGHFWANRGYYGSIYHDVAATYVLYLGWFDGNPATLHELPPVEGAKKYVEFMGGADAVLEKAKASYDAGEFRWVAEVVSKVVFADPSNQAAKDLEADALEQLGYQAESGPWRNFYLTGAQELRNGVAELPTPNTASPDTIRAMSLDLFFDYLGVRLNAEKAGEATASFNFDFTDTGEKVFVQLENGVLNHTADMQVEGADTSLTLTRDTLKGVEIGDDLGELPLIAGQLHVAGGNRGVELLVPEDDLVSPSGSISSRPEQSEPAFPPQGGGLLRITPVAGMRGESGLYLSRSSFLLSLPRGGRAGRSVSRGACGFANRFLPISVLAASGPFSSCPARSRPSASFSLARTSFSDPGVFPSPRSCSRASIRRSLSPTLSPASGASRCLSKAARMAASPALTRSCPSPRAAP